MATRKRKTEAPETGHKVDRAAAAKAIDDFIRALGLDPSRDPDLRETGKRVSDAYLDELCAGYRQDAAAALRSNTLTGASKDQVVVLREAALSTMCPHHLLPSTGTVSIAFAPRVKLAGVGALLRVARILAARLTLQESLTERITETIAEVIEPRWVACRTTFVHGCMTVRGEHAHGAAVVAWSVRGCTPHEVEPLLR
jgi:GTP cyclohydrolase I